MIARVLITSAAEMQSVAVGWQIYNLTHRPLDLGLVGLAQFAPAVLLFLIAGHTADRFPRQRILQACCAGFAVCSLLLLTLALNGVAVVWPIYAVLVGNGVVRAFNGPAGQAFLPLLVPTEVFPRAVAWGSSVFQGAMVVGPSIGGLIYGFSGSPVPVYTCSAIACIGGLVGIGAIQLQPVVRPRQNATLAMVLEGLWYIWRNKLILGAISLDSNLIAAPR